MFFSPYLDLSGLRRRNLNTLCWGRGLIFASGSRPGDPSQREIVRLNGRTRGEAQVAADSGSTPERFSPSLLTLGPNRITAPAQDLAPSWRGGYGRPNFGSPARAHRKSVTSGLISYGRELDCPRAGGSILSRHPARTLPETGDVRPASRGAAAEKISK